MSIQFEWDKNDPLKRMPRVGDRRGESRRANQALRDYALQGAARSLRSLAAHYISRPAGERPPTCKVNTLFKWSADLCWKKRVQAWEDMQMAKDEALWVERRQEWREGEWHNAARLVERAANMLEFPLAQVERVEQVYPDGRPKAVTIVNPARWSERDIAAIYKIASELARLASEMATQSMDVTSGGKPFDLTSWLEARQERLQAVVDLEENGTKDSES